MVGRKFLEDLMSLDVEDFCECDIFTHRLIFFSWDMLGFPRSVKSFKRTSLTSWRPRGDKFPCNSQ